MALSSHKYNQKERNRRDQKQMKNKAENWENRSEMGIDADGIRGQILLLQTQTRENER